MAFISYSFEALLIKAIIMESLTTIRSMLAGNEISVPTYQRSYSWESPSNMENKKDVTQTDVFLKDLIEYQQRDCILKSVHNKTIIKFVKLW
ncbi:MAG: hypothetical protein PHE33_06035 [Bacteroidales bacterium]|nr:hypothetical protein [Bacteroidales bacterium]